MDAYGPASTLRQPPSTMEATCPIASILMVLLTSLDIGPKPRYLVALLCLTAENLGVR